jgi:hypothetical protein
MSKLVHNSINYDDSHWSLKIDEQYVVRYVKERIYRFVIMLNPTDCRGYRLLIKYIGNDNDMHIKNTFNRKYTNDERKALLSITSNICTVLETFDLITQIEVAGNNSHYFDNLTTYVGTEKEPSMLHSHVICRGNPFNNYIGSVALRGPEPGQLFNMREGKIPWTYKDTLQIIVTLDNIYSSMFK